MSADPTPVTIAVAPTLTTVASLDVRALGLVTLHVQNLDPTQTATGYIHMKVAPSMGAAGPGAVGPGVAGAPAVAAPVDPAFAVRGPAVRPRAAARPVRAEVA